jgi:hypothetical protein
MIGRNLSLTTVIFLYLLFIDISDDDHCYSNTTVCFCSLITDLLPYLPKLKNLIINSVHFDGYDCYQEYEVCEKCY